MHGVASKIIWLSATQSTHFAPYVLMWPHRSLYACQSSAPYSAGRPGSWTSAMQMLCLAQEAIQEKLSAGSCFDPGAMKRRQE